MAEEEKEKKLRFLKNSAFHFQDSCSEQARFLMWTHQSIADTKYKEERVCPYCFQCRLPENHRVRFKPKRRLTPQVQRVLNREAANRTLSLKQVKILQKYKNSTSTMLVTCYSCNKTSRHSGVKRDFLAALSHNPNTPNSCGKRRDAARTPKSTGKGSVSHIKSGAKGKSPATTPRSTSSRPATPSPSTKPIGVKKSPFSHLKMLLNLEQKQSSKKGGLQDFLCSL